MMASASAPSSTKSPLNSRRASISIFMTRKLRHDF
jgi:hypothetical protein